MDFGALPPEVNSGRMYSGPGSTPLRTASAAWNLLAAELEQAATGYQSTIDTLADDEWRGPTSASMVAAVDPYITWMNTTAAKAGHTAAQAVGGRDRLRDRLRDDGAAPSGSGQPSTVGDAGRHQCPGPEHGGHRRQRGSIR